MRRRGVAGVICAVALVAGCGSSSSYGGAGGAATTAAASVATTAQATAACASAAKAPPSTVPGAPLDTLLRVPAQVRGRPAPLVLALHFASGDGAQMEQATQLTPQARRAGFVVAYPTATSNGFWAGAGEFGAVTKTLQAIRRVACIDPRRIYLTGISNGGGMASELACAFAERFAAVALFAPAVGAVGDCRPARPISVLEVHGSADPIVPYSSVAGFIGTWARLDGCSAHPVSSRLRPTATLQRWRGCDGGAVVEHIRLAGGKHIELMGQLRSAGVDPARTAWRFLAPHRLPV
jgi:polyhydroxybutyrate depolymerase